MGASKAAASTANARARAKPDPPFATLAPRVKNISQATIRKKWKPLPVSSQEKVGQILLDVKTKRCGAARIPAVTSKMQPRGKKRPISRAQVKEDEYEKAVEEVADKLLSRLPRMPFPPANGGRSSKSNSNSNSIAADDSAFDLSATLHRITALQAQLTMNTQSANLLRMQIKREQRALRRDHAELDGLETALKSSQTLRRKKEMGLHPLARALGQNQDTVWAEHVERANLAAGISGSRGPTAAAVAARHGAALSTSLSALSSSELIHRSRDPPAEGDPDLDPLLKQLRSHLLSMQNNTRNLNPVMAAMDEARTTLDRFAIGTFDDEGLRRLCGL
ncbi:hypothetical protein A1O3_09320 [Capronia epimyces CBS 606.96]|uniref:Uncharacterized protein n=1 Tax=Capronia epimyces CBS 606.96 TaxID=1182542 RepID=W9Y6V8_9EURO|nr:uncharacterized protein A1O3_09320 [Capronia epimyces CBS 606.96]EXJ78159.1 hypothetical protein A1O3_09320 [Capronia epimyces CBS 606.96]